MGQAYGQQGLDWTLAKGMKGYFNYLCSCVASRSLLILCREGFRLMLIHAPVHCTLTDYQALAIMAQPTHMPTSAKLLAELADEIVYLSGDKAVDPAWYISRAGVSMVYASSELFMTTDNSDGFGETLVFLRRRMEEARSIKGTFEAFGQWASFNTMGAINIMRSWGLKV